MFADEAMQSTAIFIELDRYFGNARTEERALDDHLGGKP